MSADENTYNDGAIQSTTVTDLFGRTVQTQRITPQLPQAPFIPRPIWTRWAEHRSYTVPITGRRREPGDVHLRCSGRATNVLYPDGSREYFAWTGDVVAHTDPAGAKRSSRWIPGPHRAGDRGSERREFRDNELHLSMIESTEKLT